LRIIGVVEKSSFMPLTGGTAGMFLMNPDVATIPVVRVSKDGLASTIAKIDAAWRRLSPDVPLKRRFADEQFDIGFKVFAQINRALAMLALLASAIAVVGLIGMALHVTRRRQHEIGVRKTLGASVSQVLGMLLRDLLKPVVIANLVMWPLVYAMMSAYLSIFSHRTALTPTPFLGSLLLSVLVACAAVGVQTFRAARLRPAEVLRYE
jgi:putative ABC transport system permease protein